MSAPAVSAVIATRDRPEMLAEAISAVVRQDYPGVIETIVVFDQSEPDYRLARTNSRRPIHVITNTRTAGLAGARNSGILAACGDLVGFCDDDDYWRAGKVSRQVAALAADPAASLVSCGIRVNYGDDVHDRWLPTARVEFADLLRDRHTELHPSTFLMRRSALLEGFGLVDEGVPGGFGEDYEFLLRAARYGHITTLPEVLTVIRWHRSSYFFRRWETMADGLSWLLARYPEFEQTGAGSARVRGQIAFAHAAQRNRRAAWRWATSAMRRNLLEPRTPIALAVASGLASPDWIMAALHRRGRGF